MCGACNDVIAEARGRKIHESKKKKKNTVRDTLNPFSTTLGSDVRVAPTQMDTPKTATGRIGLNVGRYLGYGQGLGIGTAAGITAGGYAGAGIGALIGLGAQALGVRDGAYLGAGIGAGIGGGIGGVKGAVYGTRKGIGLGGRAARYVATGTTDLPSEGDKRKKKSSKQQHRIYEKEMLVYSAEPMDIDIDPDVERKFNRAARNRKLAALGGLALGTGLGAVAGRKIGGALGSKGSSGFAAGYGSALGGFAGGTLGSRVGGRVADLLQAPDYAAYSAELNKNIRR